MNEMILSPAIILSEDKAHELLNQKVDSEVLALIEKRATRFSKQINSNERYYGGIKTKYKVGDKTYTIITESKTEPCGLCDSTGRVQYKEKDMSCPYCNGSGEVKINGNINKVIEEPYIISTIKTTTNKYGTVIKYKGNCGDKQLNRAEENLFNTYEEANTRCNFLNRHREIINIADIIITDNFVKTIPEPYKIQKRVKEYKETGKFKTEIVLSRNKKLIDGYTTYLACKMFGIESIKCVIEDE